MSFSFRSFERARIRALARRLTYFWIVWTLLLFVHEGGHAVSAARQGLDVRQLTVGMGPVLWRSTIDGTRVVLRLVPVAGVTHLGDRGTHAASHTASTGRGDIAHREPADWQAWRQQLGTLVGGVGATLGLALALAAVVAVRERRTRRTWTLGRFIVADAVVLTVFNFLPVPPLDGGRALLSTVAVMRGEPLSGDALFWVQAGGMALAVLPMTLWTRWTSRIDAAALRWGSRATTSS